MRVWLIVCLVGFLSIIHAKPKNQPFDVYFLEGKKEGPTLLVVGGIHGDEPGGYFAPAILASYYQIIEGNLYVIPNLNPDSILAFKRGLYNDMNRKFASIKKTDPDYDNVMRIKEIILDPKIDFIINLHDGHGFYRKKWENSIFNPRAWGQSYVIDQKSLDNVKFGNLDEIAKRMETRLNQNLHHDFHTFNIKNTETKFKDEEQQRSLTFFAITHLKPALALETSKNIQELSIKTLYQLLSVEALMHTLGITFERDFELNKQAIEEKIASYGSLMINHNIQIDLVGIKPLLPFIPLMQENNHFEFEHPLGRINQTNQGFEVYIGHKKITTLKPDYFKMGCSFQSISLELDGQLQEQVKFPSTLEFEKGFIIKHQNNARVNVIGYSKPGIISEDEIYLTPKDINKSYALDKQQSIFKVEVYEKDRFCGMINLKEK